MRVLIGFGEGLEERWRGGGSRLQKNGDVGLKMNSGGGLVNDGGYISFVVGRVFEVGWGLDQVW